MRRENLEGLQTRERRRPQVFDRTPVSSRHGGARRLKIKTYLIRRGGELKILIRRIFSSQPWLSSHGRLPVGDSQRLWRRFSVENLRLRRGSS